MLNPTEVLADALGNQLAAAYRRAFSGREPRYTEVIAEAAKLILERIGSSDALYHSAEHTAMVALVGQDILRGERLRRDVTAEDWLHFTLATLMHDIGYVRGVCRGDRRDAYVINATGETVSPPRGASDAFLAPWHVERSKIAVRERFENHPFINSDRILWRDRADAISGAGGRGLRRDRHRGRSVASRGFHRPARRSVLPTQAQRPVS